MAKSKITERKEVLKIQLSGSLNTEINYLFEIYRQAVMNKLAGYVEKQTNGKIEVVVSGQGIAIDHFILWLKNFVGQYVNINIEKKDDQTSFQEFRIISLAKTQGL